MHKHVDIYQSQQLAWKLPAQLLVSGALGVKLYSPADLIPAAYPTSRRPRVGLRSLKVEGIAHKPMLGDPLETLGP